MSVKFTKTATLPTAGNIPTDTIQVTETLDAGMKIHVPTSDGQSLIPVVDGLIGPEAREFLLSLSSRAVLGVDGLRIDGVLLGAASTGPTAITIPPTFVGLIANAPVVDQQIGVAVMPALSNGYVTNQFEFRVGGVIAPDTPFRLSDVYDVVFTATKAGEDDVQISYQVGVVGVAVATASGLTPTVTIGGQTLSGHEVVTLRTTAGGALSGVSVTGGTATPSNYALSAAGVLTVASNGSFSSEDGNTIEATSDQGNVIITLSVDNTKTFNYSVNDQAEFGAAFTEIITTNNYLASGDAQIILANGEYTTSSTTFKNRDFLSTFTIKSKNRLGAKFTTITDIYNADNLTFDGINFESTVLLQFGSDQISFMNGRHFGVTIDTDPNAYDVSPGGPSVRAIHGIGACQNITIENNDINGWGNGIVLGELTGPARIVGNMIDNCFEDCVKLGGGFPVDFGENFIPQPVASATSFGDPHGDAVQFLGGGLTADWTDINIYRNIFISTHTDRSNQCVFLDDCPAGIYFSVKAHGNIVVNVGGSTTGIRIRQAKDCELLSNTVVSHLGTTAYGTGIILGDDTNGGGNIVKRCVADVIDAPVGTILEDNVELGTGGATIPYADAFVGPTFAPYNRADVLAMFAMKPSGPLDIDASGDGSVGDIGAIGTGAVTFPALPIGGGGSFDPAHFPVFDATALTGFAYELLPSNPATISLSALDPKEAAQTPNAKGRLVSISDNAGGSIVATQASALRRPSVGHVLGGHDAIGFNGIDDQEMLETNFTPSGDDAWFAMFVQRGKQSTKSGLSSIRPCGGFSANNSGISFGTRGGNDPASSCKYFYGAAGSVQTQSDPSTFQIGDREIMICQYSKDNFASAWNKDERILHTTDPTELVYSPGVFNIGGELGSTGRKCAMVVSHVIAGNGILTAADRAAIIQEFSKYESAVTANVMIDSTAISTIGSDVGASQGVASGPGVKFVAGGPTGSNSREVRVYNSDFSTLHGIFDVATISGITPTQANTLTFNEGTNTLYVGSNNFNTTPMLGWLIELSYNPTTHALTYVDNYSMGANWNEGGGFRLDPVNGLEFFSANHNNHGMDRYRVSDWAWQQFHPFPTSSHYSDNSSAGGLLAQAVEWDGDIFYVNTHKSNPKLARYDVYKYDGSTGLVTSVLPPIEPPNPDCGQGFELKNGSALWAERVGSPIVGNVVQATGVFRNIQVG